MNKLHKELNEAILAFTMGDELKAEEGLLGITAKFPDSLEAWRALAEVYLAKGTLEQAEKACRKALSLDADDLASVVSLSRILVRIGDKEGAEEATAHARVLGWKEELAQGDSPI